MKRTYHSPFVEIISTDLQYALLQESDFTKMDIDTETVIPGQIDDGNKLVNHNILWDEYE